MSTRSKFAIGKYVIAAAVCGWLNGAAVGSAPAAGGDHAVAAGGGHEAALTGNAPSVGNRFVRAETPQPLTQALAAAEPDGHVQSVGPAVTEAGGSAEAHGSSSSHGAVASQGTAAAQGGAAVKSGAAAVDAAEPDELQEIVSDLMAGNRRFVAGRESDRELLKRRVELVAGQHPKVAILSCADSRVPPELIFDKNIGELFVVRVAGNLSDPALAGSLEYAVEHLGVKVIVVLGHEKCGAVAAAASGAWMPSANLHEIVKRIYPAIEEAKEAGSTDATVQSVANVRNTVRQLTADSEILAKAAGAGHVLIVPAIYRLGTGVVDQVSEGSLAEAAAGSPGAAKTKGERATASTH